MPVKPTAARLAAVTRQNNTIARAIVRRNFMADTSGNELWLWPSRTKCFPSKSLTTRVNFQCAAALRLGAASLKHRDVFQQRDHAEDDDDDARDLLGAAVERQQVDQIENENNDEKCNQRDHQHATS